MQARLTDFRELTAREITGFDCIRDKMVYLDGLAQDCSNSMVLAMELLQLCAKPLIYPLNILRLTQNGLHFTDNIFKLFLAATKQL